MEMIVMKIKIIIRNRNDIKGNDSTFEVILYADLFSPAILF